MVQPPGTMAQAHVLIVGVNYKGKKRAIAKRERSQAQWGAWCAIVPQRKDLVGKVGALWGWLGGISELLSTRVGG